MPRFIKLTYDSEPPHKTLVNIDHIITVNPHNDMTGILVSYPEHGYFIVKENFEEVERILNGTQ